MMPLVDPQPDHQLLARIKQGESPALSELYRRHQGPVYRFALLWSGSENLAADVTQDVFLHLLTQQLAYDPSRGSLAAFLCGVARNLVRRQNDRQAAFAAMPDEDSDTLLPEQWIDSHTPMDSLLLNEDLQQLRSAILRLPPHYRDVLVLCDLQELSYAEVAAICGCELGTVRSRLNRARGLLSQALAQPEMRPKAQVRTL